MKVLIVNGSPRPKGNTSIALHEMTEVFSKENIDFDYLNIGNKDIRGCIACGRCAQTGKCVFNDIVNEVKDKLGEYSGIIIASPVYFGGPNATLTAFMTRLFYRTDVDLRMVVGASVVCARRSGTTATFDELNKFFTIREMPVVSSYYWNNIHGREAGEAVEDEEGKSTMRQLARNMIFLMRGIELAKEKYGLPEKEDKALTNFIR